MQPSDKDSANGPPESSPIQLPEQLPDPSRPIPPVCRIRFPEYVPNNVRKLIAHYMQACQAQQLAIETQKKDVEAELSACTEKGLSAERLNDLRRQKLEIANDFEKIKYDIDRLRRLATDPRMEKAYRKLNKAFDDDTEKDRKIEAFILASWDAQHQYQRYRERLVKAQAKKMEVAKKAEELAKALREIVEFGIACPPELFSIRECLCHTNHRDTDSPEFHQWPAIRHTILGECREDTEDTDLHNKDTDPHNKDTHLDYAWGKAPMLSDLLDTVTQAARKRKPGKPGKAGMIGAAIEKRESGTAGVTAYLRAFEALLRGARIERTHDIDNAMATAATVAINKPSEIELTPRDVKDKLGKSRVTQPEK